MSVHRQGAGAPDTWPQVGPTVAVPDVDCNGVVNVVDIQLVAARWNTSSGNPLFHARYDLNGDNAIDVADIVVVAGRWQ